MTDSKNTFQQLIVLGAVVVLGIAGYNHFTGAETANAVSAPGVVTPQSDTSILDVLAAKGENFELTGRFGNCVSGCDTERRPARKAKPAPVVQPVASPCGTIQTVTCYRPVVTQPVVQQRGLLCPNGGEAFRSTAVSGGWECPTVTTYAQPTVYRPVAPASQPRVQAYQQPAPAYQAPARRRLNGTSGQTAAYLPQSDAAAIKVSANQAWGQIGQGIAVGSGIALAGHLNRPRAVQQTPSQPHVPDNPGGTPPVTPPNPNPVTPPDNPGGTPFTPPVDAPTVTPPSNPMGPPDNGGAGPAD